MRRWMQFAWNSKYNMSFMNSLGFSTNINYAFKERNIGLIQQDSPSIIQILIYSE